MGGAWGGTGRSKGKGNTNSTYYKKIQFQQKENSTKLTVRPKILYQNLLLQMLSKMYLHTYIKWV